MAPMPELSRFFGIVIAMYYDDHPPPHFHAIYGSEKANPHRSPGLLKGRLGPGGDMVTEWPRSIRRNCWTPGTTRHAGNSPRLSRFDRGDAI